MTMHISDPPDFVLCRARHELGFERFFISSTQPRRTPDDLVSCATGAASISALKTGNQFSIRLGNAKCVALRMHLVHRQRLRLPDSGTPRMNECHCLVTYTHDLFSITILSVSTSTQSHRNKSVGVRLFSR